MADDEGKKGVGLLGGIAAIGAGVGTAAGSAVHSFGKKAAPAADAAAEVAEKFAAATKGVAEGNFITRPIAAFKGLGGGGKATAVGLGVVATVGTGWIISKLRGGSYAEQVEAERANIPTSPNR